MFIKIFSLIVLITLIATIIGALFYLAALPGRTAKARNHPYAEAVNVAGWTTILTGGVFWPAALIWAYAGTPAQNASAAEASRPPAGDGAAEEVSP